MARRLRTPSQRIWALNIFVALLTLALAVGPARGIEPIHDHRMSWWIIALGIAFAVAELLAVNLQFRGEAHTFTLSEIPLVLGLYFAAPANLFVAQVVGTGLARAFGARQSPIKQGFNLTAGALDAVVAITVFHGLAPRVFGPGQWAMILLATVSTTLISSLLVSVVIAFVEGELHLSSILTTATPALIVTATNSSLALAATAVIHANPLAATLLVVPCGTLLLAYRAYTSQRAEHERVEFLYRCSRLLQSTADADGVAALLSEVRDAFRAEWAELVIVPGQGDASLLRSRVELEGPVAVMAPLSEGDGNELVHAASSRPGAVLVENGDDHPFWSRYLAGYGAEDGMVAALTSDDRVMGVLIVGQRLGDIGRFTVEDVRLFDALASQMSVSLESDRLERALTQLEEVQGQLTHQALHDPLTGLANRALFADRVQHALAARDVTRRVAVLFVDLDDFKTVNDTLGHAVGDELLKEVSGRLRATLRPHDTPARLGGDEFAVLIEDAGGPETALEVADRIREALSMPVLLTTGELVVGASVGLALASSDDDTAADLLRYADVAMYSAKGRGKACVELYDPGMHALVVARHELKADLQSALEREELGVNYQPLVSVATGEIVGVEALVRWHHPRRGLVPPMEFIPVAEDTGLVVTLGRQVLRRACEDARRWALEVPGADSLELAVNVSARELQQRDYAAYVAEVLRETGIDPTSLVLEITETVLVGNSDQSVAGLHRLRELGIRIAVDDFGTGYASLGYLRRLPIDILKVEKSFIQGIGDDGDDRVFARAIVSLGKSLGLVVVAEGVENATHLEEISAIGCDLAQGYYFSRPVGCDKLASLLASPTWQITV